MTSTACLPNIRENGVAIVTYCSARFSSLCYERSWRGREWGRRAVCVGIEPLLTSRLGMGEQW